MYRKKTKDFCTSEIIIDLSGTFLVHINTPCDVTASLDRLGMGSPGPSSFISPQFDLA